MGFSGPGELRKEGFYLYPTSLSYACPPAQLPILTVA